MRNGRRALYHTKQQKGTKTLTYTLTLKRLLYHTKQQKGTKTTADKKH